ncbi:MAG: hypothetical protein JNM25_03040 [Planctomycetes bacterium]|nr:hypothetical protein [Planctomycetota bacterium]
MHPNEDSKTPSSSPSRALRLLARLSLLAWVGFWTWFIVSVMASEGAAIEPAVMLGGLWAVAALAWFRPRIGALALAALGAWSLWFFHDPSGRWHVSLWLIALPAGAIAACTWLGAPTHRPAATHRAA